MFGPPFARRRLARPVFRPVCERLENRLVPATFPTGFTETALATGLRSPTAMAVAPDGRILVSEQQGTLRVIIDGQLQAEPYLTLAVNSTTDGGLLGITFDPDFNSNHYFYVYYTTSTSPIHNRVSRFTAEEKGIVPDSEFVVADLDPQESISYHQGGAIHFGPDGKLYIATGDNRNGTNAQSLTNRFGKILRLNPDGSIPVDNPFLAETDGPNGAIWALGLRNPFTFAFQPGTGRLFINDVGEASFEEINDGVAGGNYGWPDAEGPADPPNPNFIDPFYFYDHPTGFAITGGVFYNVDTPQFPGDYTGTYFFADWGGGWIKHIDPTTGDVTPFATDVRNPVDLQVGLDGSLYYLSNSFPGAVFQIRYSAPSPSPGPEPGSAPAPTPGPSPVTEPAPEPTRDAVPAANSDSVGTPIVGPLPDFDPGLVNGRSTVAVFEPSSATWYIRNTNDPGAPDLAPFAYGSPGWMPVVGDWNGDGQQTIGVVDWTTMTWYLRNSDNPGAPDIEPFAYGSPGWLPVVGDWDGDGATTIGVVDPTTMTWYLRNSNSPGAPDIEPFAYGSPGWVPLVGDWDGNRTTTLGVFDPSTATWYLRNRNDPGAPDFEPFAYGSPGWRPVVGDWNGNGQQTIGVYGFDASWYLKNDIAPGAPSIEPFAYGAGNWVPVPGEWAPSAALRTVAVAGRPAARLTQAELDGVVAAALARLGGSVPAARFGIADLGGDTLGLAFPTEGTVWMDDDAAGYGWFVDPTPLDDSEFAGDRRDSPAGDRIDLWTAVRHELGHLAGLSDLDPAAYPDALMAATLLPGTRHV